MTNGCDFEGLVVVATGGSRGIAASWTRQLTEGGATANALDLKRTVEQNPSEEWGHIFDVNVFGAVRMRAYRAPLRAPLPASSDRERLIHRGGRRPAQPRAAYAATTGAVEALTRALAPIYPSAEYA